MKYLLIVSLSLLCACNTNSTEKEREIDSAKVDGTRMADTLLLSDTIPPGVVNPQPD